MVFWPGGRHANGSTAEDFLAPKNHLGSGAFFYTGRLQSALVLMVLILAGVAWQEYVGPVSYFFLLLVVLLLGALVVGAIAYVWRRQKATGSQNGARSPRSR
jgi:hypothetical protein